MTTPPKSHILARCRRELDKAMTSEEQLAMFGSDPKVQATVIALMGIAYLQCKMDIMEALQGDPNGGS